MKGFALKLTKDDVNLVLQALGDRPFVEVVGLIQRINEQVRAQLKDAVDTTEE